MSKAVYVTYNNSEGLLKSLGFEIITIEPDVDFQLLIRKWKRQSITLIYVSESVFSDFSEIISRQDSEFDLIITVLPNQSEKQGVGNKRINRVIEEAMGLKLK